MVIPTTHFEGESGSGERTRAAGLDPALAERILSALSDGVVAADQAGATLFANVAAEALLGVRAADAVGQPLWQVARIADDASGAPAADLAAMERVVRATEGAVILTAHDGRERRVAAQWSNGEGTALLFLRPADDRSALEAHLLGADRMAALGTLAAGAAHEINNPLTYLLLDLDHVQRRLRAAAASEWPAEDLTPDELAGLLKSIGRAAEGANRVRRIVRDLTTFSQGDVEHRGLVDVRAVLESSMQMAWHEVRHRARLVKSLGDVPPVEANEARLAQVFLSLLVNAAQAIPEGRADENEVRVATHVDEAGNAVVEIADTGTGIQPELLPRIFDPFFTTKAAGHGTGLGLAIAHGIVKSMGGALQATSVPGVGSTFRIVLEASKSYRRVSSGRMRAVTARKRVMVIEEEELVRQALTEALQPDADVTAVSSAREGLALAAREPDYDLVLCDLMMPVMSGMDFYVEIVKAAPRYTGRIVFMTGGVFTARAKAFLQSVSNPCLEKPIDMSKLRSILARVK